MIREFSLHQTFVKMVKTNKQDCLLIEGRPLENSTHRPVLLPWPRTWPDYLEIWTWPRYSQDVPVYRKWTFRLKAFELQRPNRTSASFFVDLDPITIIYELDLKFWFWFCVPKLNFLSTLSTVTENIDRYTVTVISVRRPISLWKYNTTQGEQ